MQSKYDSETKGESKRETYWLDKTIYQWYQKKGWWKYIYWMKEKKKKNSDLLGM